MNAASQCAAIAAAAGFSLLAFGQPAAAQQQPLPSRPNTSTSDPVAAYVAEASQRFGIPAGWIRAVMRVESAGEVGVTSPAGAMGLMQVMPQTYATLRARLGLGANAYDPHDNIMAGVAFLRDMHDRYGDAGFLAAYNAGPARYEEFRAGGRPLPSETILYMARLGPMLGVESNMPLAVNVPIVIAKPEGAPIFVALHGRSATTNLHRDTSSTLQLAAADVQAGERTASLFTSPATSSERMTQADQRASSAALSRQPSSAASASPEQTNGQRETIFVQRITRRTGP